MKKHDNYTNINKFYLLINKPIKAMQTKTKYKLNSLKYPLSIDTGLKLARTISANIRLLIRSLKSEYLIWLITVKAKLLQRFRKNVNNDSHFKSLAPILTTGQKIKKILIII
jgi:hypothetical protein